MWLNDQGLFQKINVHYACNCGFMLDQAIQTACFVTIPMPLGLFFTQRHAYTVFFE